MFNNAALDVFIGLTFIILLYSLLATILQEMVAQWFSLRSRMLVRAMRRMLEDDKHSGSYWSKYTVMGFLDSIATLFARFFDPIRSDENLLRLFYRHPSIKYLGENNLFRKPAYLHSHNFSQTIMQLLRGDQYDGRMQSESALIEDSLQMNQPGIKPETLRHLRLLFADARSDSQQFKIKLEDWFDETMQRCTGWYKKQTQMILLLMGLVLAGSFNVDVIAIAKILVENKKAREQLVELAISRQKEYGDIIDTISKTTVTVKKLKDDTTQSVTETLKEPRRAGAFADSQYTALKEDAEKVQAILSLDNSEKAKSVYQKNRVLKWVGWVVTALAISLGSSFWFDLLTRLIRLRGAGVKPDTAGDTDTVKAGSGNSGKDIRNEDIKG